MMFYTGILTVMVLVAMTTADFAEKITEDGASGAQVVEQVVDLIGRLCIFDNQLFLRRMAHVETNDGTAAGTYRAGYNGGIWKIDEAMLLQTQNNTSKVRDAIKVINKELHIDWLKVTWKDLRRPIMSGLAASLYVMSRDFKTVPESLELQATIWSLLRPANTANTFYFDARGLNSSCNGDRQLDLVLVLDFANASVFDIAHVQSFMQTLLRKFRLDPGSTRVGLVTRNPQPHAGWYLNSKNGALTILDVLKFLRYRPGSATTKDSLAYTRQNMFTTANGARTGAAQVALLITDGITPNNSVRAETEKFKQNGITLMIVDVEKANVTKPSDLHLLVPEPKCQNSRITLMIVDVNKAKVTQPRDLHLLVPEPKCQNSRQIDDFNKLDKLSDDLANIICNVPIILTERFYSYSCGNQLVARLPDSTNSVTVEISTSGDDIDIFGSKYYSSPDKSANDVHVTSTASKPSVLFVRGTDPFYIRVQGKNSTCRGSYTVKVKLGQPAAGGNGTCIVAGTVRQCTGTEMMVASKDVILTKTDKFPYLCDPQNNSIEYFPHPLYRTKFVMCDEHDQVFVGMCPGNQTTCRPITSGCKYTNPCPSHVNLNGSDTYFIDPCGNQDDYVKCSFFGMAEVVKCRPEQVWNEDTRTCVFTYVHDLLHRTDDKNLTNPCVHSHENHVYFPYPNNVTRYIFCDVRGNAFALTCRNGEWNEQTKSCTSLNPPHLIG